MNDRSNHAVRGLPMRFAPKHKPHSQARAIAARHGLLGVKSKDKVLPVSVLRLPNDQLARFLQVLWMCDGYVDARGPGIQLASEQLVRQIQHALLRFGIQSRVNRKSNRLGGKEFASWRLRVYTESLESFACHIPLWGNKANRLKLLQDKSRNANVGCPTISDSLRDDMRVAFNSISSDDRGQLAAQLGRPYGLRFGDLFNLPAKGAATLCRPVFRAFCENFGLTDEYQRLLSNEVFWDKVVSVVDAGDREVYDLSVEPTRCFVANDVIVHNSTVSSDLARALTAAGRRVLVFDADLYGPTMPLLFPVDDPRLRTRRKRIVPHVVDGVEVVSLGHILEADEAVEWRGPGWKPPCTCSDLTWTPRLTWCW